MPEPTPSVPGSTLGAPKQAGFRRVDAPASVFRPIAYTLGTAMPAMAATAAGGVLMHLTSVQSSVVVALAAAIAAPLGFAKGLSDWRAAHPGDSALSTWKGTVRSYLAAVGEMFDVKVSDVPKQGPVSGSETVPAQPRQREARDTVA